MARDYKIFDADRVQFNTRQRVTRMYFLVAAAGVGSILLLGLWQSGQLSAVPTFLFLVVTWLGVTGLVQYRLRQLRQVLWCVKVSPDQIVGYDYARRSITIRWMDLDRICLDDDQVTLVCHSDRRFVIPTTFSRFPELSHGLVHISNRHNIPLYIDGQAFEELDIYQIFPFLSDDSSAADASRGSATL